MNRVSRRASAVILLVAVLLGGLGFFVYEYSQKAAQWVVSPGSPHVYNSTNIGMGTVVDREGVVLLSITENRAYGEDRDLRESTVHWLGDRKGQISAPAISHYAKEMTGYDPVDGLYSYKGSGGRAELTLSAEVQTAALKALGDRKGTVAVYNYRTGEILCAVTAPTYDPDNVPDIEADTTGAYEGVYLNRFVQSTYVPGSIFKVVTTAAALDTIGDIESQTFKCTGKYGSVTCENNHGKQDLKKALANSCNCAFAQIAEQLGKETLEAYVDQFRLTEAVSFDGVTTARGSFDLTDANPTEMAWGAIGQYTDLVNPCRFMTFMGMIAGGGEAAQPYLVKEVSAHGKVTYTAETAMTDRVMSRELAEALQECMRNNVEVKYGAENFPGMTVCAKSGTSQLGGDQEPNSMFAGFVLDEEYPLAFMVVVENGGYGSSTCVPIISEVLSVCKEVMD